MDQNTSGNSILRRSWKRLLRIKTALLGMLVILSAVVISILGYLITPDKTPYANDMVLQIGSRSPGFKVQMLKVRKNKEVVNPGIFQTMLHGRENKYSLVPFTDFRFDGADIVVKEYSKGLSSGGEMRYNLTNVVHPKSITKQEVIARGNQLSFYNINDEGVSESVESLRTKILQDHIVNRTYLLGTDKFGRDTLSRLIIGVRVSLSVGFIAVLISLLIGVSMGAIAGYFRGRVDDAIMWVINVIWSIPTLLLVFAITLALGKGFWQIFVAVGLSMWVEVARIIRGQVMSIREIEYVEATRALGYSHMRSIVKHILPNVLGPVMVIAAANFAAAILIEAGLSFLGIGVRPPTPSWGWMMKENYGHIISGQPFLAIIPGLAIMIMVLAFNLLGNGLRDVMDVKTKLQF